jgi:hypothetical protein
MSHCVKTNLAEKGVCLKTKNPAQIKIVFTGQGGTNGNFLIINAENF